jgi:hypothetical protein
MCPCLLLEKCNMQPLKILLLIGAPLGINSCAPRNPYAGPPIPLGQALTAIGDGMREADRASGGGKSTGLIPAKATVAFNVVNTTSNGAGLSLEVVPVPGLTAGGTMSTSSSQQGTSSITVEYTSVLLASKDTIVGSKPAAEREKLIEDLRGQITTLKRKNTELLNQNTELMSKPGNQ